jgi:hypothetical protein
LTAARSAARHRKFEAELGDQPHEIGGEELGPGETERMHPGEQERQPDDPEDQPAGDAVDRRGVHLAQQLGGPGSLEQGIDLEPPDETSHDELRDRSDHPAGDHDEQHREDLREESPEEVQEVAPGRSEHGEHFVHGSPRRWSEQ